MGSSARRSSCPAAQRVCYRCRYHSDGIRHLPREGCVRGTSIGCRREAVFDRCRWKVSRRPATSWLVTNDRGGCDSLYCDSLYQHYPCFEEHMRGHCLAKKSRSRWRWVSRRAEAELAVSAINFCSVIAQPIIFPPLARRQTPLSQQFYTHRQSVPVEYPSLPPHPTTKTTKKSRSAFYLESAYSCTKVVHFVCCNCGSPDDLAFTPARTSPSANLA